MTRYPLGVVEVVFRPLEQAAAAAEARRLGFDHFDAATEPAGPLALPVIDIVASGAPVPGRTSGALPEAPGNWDRAVRAFRRAPGARVEPWPGSILSSIAAVRAFLAEAPGTTLLLDTGHIAYWGEDPSELIPLATHVQLRQARRGVAQALPDEGDVDFAAFVTELDRHDYAGALSVEYFDLPDRGWPLDDPVAHAVALAEHVRPLLEV